MAQKKSTLCSIFNVNLSLCVCDLNDFPVAGGVLLSFIFMMNVFLMSACMDGYNAPPTLLMVVSIKHFRFTLWNVATCSELYK